MAAHVAGEIDAHAAFREAPLPVGANSVSLPYRKGGTSLTDGRCATPKYDAIHQ